MEYCPRCGENSAFGQGSTDRRQVSGTLRLPADSKIVNLPDLAGESVSEVSYGGTRFRVRRSGADLLLTPLE